MARERKLKDPTEAALSAVENALNLNPQARPDPAEDGTPLEPRLPEIAEDELLRAAKRAEAAAESPAERTEAVESAAAVRESAPQPPPAANVLAVPGAATGEPPAA